MVIPREATAVPGMTDMGFRAWVALDRWAWNGRYPSNKQLAKACGWIAEKSGNPSTSKAKRALRELEGLGLIRRITASDDGRLKREGIEVLRPKDWGRRDVAPDVEPDRLQAMPYDEYLRSPEWLAYRKRRVEQAGHRCQVCNNRKTTLNVHHRTYERRGCERDSDTVVLCGDCHRIFHENGKLAQE